MISGCASCVSLSAYTYIQRGFLVGSSLHQSSTRSNPSTSDTNFNDEEVATIPTDSTNSVILAIHFIYCMIDMWAVENAQS